MPFMSHRPPRRSQRASPIFRRVLSAVVAVALLVDPLAPSMLAAGIAHAQTNPPASVPSSPTSNLPVYGQVPPPVNVPGLPSDVAPAPPQLGMANVQTSLPDLGDASFALVSPAQERKLGETVARQIRGSGGYLDDPEVNDYLNELGHRLVAARPDSPWDFEFCAMADPVINAFAIPGGFVCVNVGLILMTQTESELASVLAHEITHVTQHHYVRDLSSQKDALLLQIAAMLVADRCRGEGRQSGRPGGERGHRDRAGPRHPEPAQLHAAERVRGRPHRIPAPLRGRLRDRCDGDDVPAAAEAKSHFRTATRRAICARTR